MQFRDLKAQYKKLKPEIDSVISEVLEASNFISGTPVEELETEMAEYVGAKHCISCANGTDALSLVMMAWEIQAGDAVFVPDFTFFASGEVVSFEGATPVFYDVDADTYNADIDSLERAIQAVLQEGELNPRAIIAVDLFGLPADYDALEAIAEKHELLLLEDGAQGFGGSYKGRKACSFGNAATTSFFPAKPLGCYGDGGAIFTNDDRLAEYLISVRVHGKGSSKYDNVRIGCNSRLDTLQAAILRVKFQAFREYELKDINAVAKKYTEKLSEILKTPMVPGHSYSSWAQYTIQLESKEQRDGLQTYLKEQGIPSMIYYCKPMHAQGAFQGLVQYEKCSVTEQLCDTVLSLPIHPYMENCDIEKVTAQIKMYLDK